MRKLIALLMFITMATGVDASQPKAWEMTFQEAATPVMEQLTHLHNMLLYIIFGIVIFVFLLLAVTLIKFRAKANPTPSTVTHHTFLEVVWTLIPVLILVVIAIPSFKLLYFMDRAHEAQMTVKVIGNQWYWTYEYPDEKMAFDSRLIEDKDLKPGQMRLLETDNPLVVPVGVPIRVLVTSTDVLHSWAVPSFGVKQDTIPGRLRETWIQVNKEGMYYGQCSELCGILHGFMPINVKAVSKEDYQTWLAENKTKFAAS